MIGDHPTVLAEVEISPKPGDLTVVKFTHGSGVKAKRAVHIRGVEGKVRAEMRIAKTVGDLAVLIRDLEGAMVFLEGKDG